MQGPQGFVPGGFAGPESFIFPENYDSVPIYKICSSVYNNCVL